MSWRNLAACAGMNPATWFDPTHGSGLTAAEAAAKTVCVRCPVRIECLHHALDQGEEFGIWGGLTAAERETYARTGRRSPEPIVHGTIEHAKRCARSNRGACPRCRYAIADHRQRFRQKRKKG